MRCFIALAALAASACAKSPPSAEFLMAATGQENTLTTYHHIAPCDFIGGFHNDATLAYLAAIALAYGTNPEETLELVKGWGVVLLVAMRSKAAWQTRNYFEQTDSERAFSLSAAQWAAMAAVLLSCFQIAFMSVDGGSLPQNGAILGSLFINTMRSMGMCGTTPDKRGRFSKIITATHAGLFAMELALSDPDARAAAVALSFKYNLGPIMLAACVFGTFDDVLALTYPLTLAIIGKPDAYRPVMFSARILFHDVSTTSTPST